MDGTSLQAFVQGYAQRSNLTVATLFVSGYRAYPCDCGDEGCEGFQMLSGDARYEYEYATMLGKRPVQLTVDELETAWRVRNRLALRERA